MSIRRALLFGTTILAGLVVLADSAPAQQLKNKATNGLRSRVLVTTPMLGGGPQHYRKRSAAMPAGDLSKQRKPAQLVRTLPPSLGAGANLRLRESLNRGPAHHDQVSPGQTQTPRRASRNFKKPFAITPPVQGPAVDLGMTPAGKKIEALRDKLGLESIAAVEGAGPASGGQTSSPSRASGGASSTPGQAEPGQGSGQRPARAASSAGECMDEAGAGLPNPRGKAETGHRVPSSRIHGLMRDIAEGAGWAPALRPDSFRSDHGVWHGESNEGDDVDVIRGSRGITIIVYNQPGVRTTRYVYDRSEAGDVKLNRTETEYGPDSSDSGLVETQYPDPSPGHGNTITRTRHSGSQDSQPAEGASDGPACGEAAVRHEQAEAERKRNEPIRFRDPKPGGQNGVIIKPANLRTRDEADDMTCQSAPDSDDCRGHNGAANPTRRAQDFAQPANGSDGSVIPDLSDEESPGEAPGELIDPTPDGDPDAMAGR